MNKIDESIDNHLVALETFSSDRWDTLYVPLIGKASVVQSRKRKEYNSIGNEMNVHCDISFSFLTKLIFRRIIALGYIRWCIDCRNEATSIAKGYCCPFEKSNSCCRRVC